MTLSRGQLTLSRAEIVTWGGGSNRPPAKQSDRFERISKFYIPLRINQRGWYNFSSLHFRSEKFNFEFLTPLTPLSAALLIFVNMGVGGVAWNPSMYRPVLFTLRGLIINFQHRVNFLASYNCIRLGGVVAF